MRRVAPTLLWISWLVCIACFLILLGVASAEDIATPGSMPSIKRNERIWLAVSLFSIVPPILLTRHVWRSRRERQQRGFNVINGESSS